MGEVFSRAEGYNTLNNLWGAMAFHFVSMFLGGFFFKKSITAPAPAEKVAG